MRTRPLVFVAAILALVQCSPEDDNNEEQSPLVEPCMEACGKAACAADVGVNCRAYCEDTAQEATDIGDPCPEDLQVLFECQEELSCLEYLDWYNEAPEAACLDAEAKVVESCPGVQLR